MIVTTEQCTVVSITQNPIALIERAGRVCYKSEDKTCPGSGVKLVTKLIESGHESVLEHANMTVKVVCDRGISHEIVRHRLASYSQESTRYVTYDTGAVILHIFDDSSGNVPLDEQIGFDLLAGEGAFADLYTRLTSIELRWLFACLNDMRTYQTQIIDGVAPQMARANLPTCLKTEIFITMNMREWRHFILMRGGTGAHPQVALIADAIYRYLYSVNPVLVKNRVIQKPLPDCRIIKIKEEL